MPKRPDIQSVLVIGSGPIVIGQAAEFDYSGTQACRVLRAEGVRVILVNPNPATIMTDPDFADATYIEPITTEVLTKIIEKEQPDAVLPTLGGQTALNAAIALDEAGILAKYGVELIGAKVEAIQKGEDRQIFKELVIAAGAEVARSHIAHTVGEAVDAADDLGYPLVVRPSFTMGGPGLGLRPRPRRTHPDGRPTGCTRARPPRCCSRSRSLGWKEYELELMRDTADNTVVVCSIENVDPVGVHTGDSITVAPALTLTDREYQRLRDIGIDIIRAGRRRHRRLQHPVRGRARRRPHHRHRDEPAGVAIERAGVEGHGLPDREDRRAPRDRLPARRDPQRDHRGSDAGELRADARLRRGQGAAVRVREVPVGGCDAHDDDEERRRGDGDRPQLLDGAAEGAAQPREAGEQLPLGRRAAVDGRAARDRRRSRPTAGSSRCSRRCARARPSSSCSTPPRSTPGSSTRSC